MIILHRDHSAIGGLGQATLGENLSSHGVKFLSRAVKSKEKCGHLTPTQGL